MKLFSPNFERQPLTDFESALEPMERAWVDFLYGARLKNRFIRDPGRSGMRGHSLATVHRHLDDYRRQFVDEGNRTALFTALVCCVEENVPMPYWLGNEVLEVWKTVNRIPSDLHQLFGLDAKVPTKGKRAITTRRDLQLRHKLWSSVRELVADAQRNGQKMSIDAAIRKARADLEFPYLQRQSRVMFDEQERIFSVRADATKGKKTHRAR